MFNQQSSLSSLLIFLKNQRLQPAMVPPEMEQVRNNSSGKRKKLLEVEEAKEDIEEEERKSEQNLEVVVASQTQDRDQG